MVHMPGLGKATIPPWLFVSHGYVERQVHSQVLGLAHLLRCLPAQGPLSHPDQVLSVILLSNLCASGACEASCNVHGKSTNVGTFMELSLPIPDAAFVTLTGLLAPPWKKPVVKSLNGPGHWWPSAGDGASGLTWELTPPPCSASLRPSPPRPCLSGRFTWNPQKGPL